MFVQPVSSASNAVLVGLIKVVEVAIILRSSFLFLALQSAEESICIEVPRARANSAAMVLDAGGKGFTAF